MTQSIWDSPEFKEAVPPSNYMKFGQKGDWIRGTVESIRPRRFPPKDGETEDSVSIEITFSGASGLSTDRDTGEKTEYENAELTFTAGAVLLKQQLKNERPVPGDVLYIGLADIETRQGGRKLRHWDVKVDQRGGSTGSPAPASGNIDQQAKLHEQALASLTPEQK